MENIKEKVSYLKGLSDGLGITHESKEGKMLLAIIDVLDDVAEELECLDESHAELDEYVEAIDEDLSEIENDIYGEEEDSDEEDDEDDGMAEIECPKCHETIYVDAEMLDDDDDKITCPNCGEPIYFECECCCDDECSCEDHE